MFVNYSGKPSLQRFHGKAIALDIKDRYAPFPSLFIIHEMRVRGFHPFSPVAPAMPQDSPWQDWIRLEDPGVFDNTTDSFNRDSPRGSGGSVSALQQQPHFQPTVQRRVQAAANRLADAH